MVALSGCFQASGVATSAGLSWSLISASGVQANSNRTGKHTSPRIADPPVQGPQFHLVAPVYAEFVPWTTRGRRGVSVEFRKHRMLSDVKPREHFTIRQQMYEKRTFCRL